jgi:hypothetical protein
LAGSFFAEGSGVSRNFLDRPDESRDLRQKRKEARGRRLKESYKLTLMKIEKLIVLIIPIFWKVQKGLVGGSLCFVSHEPRRVSQETRQVAAVRDKMF